MDEAVIRGAELEADRIGHFPGVARIAGQKTPAGRREGSLHLPQVVDPLLMRDLGRVGGIKADGDNLVIPVRLERHLIQRIYETVEKGRADARASKVVQGQDGGFSDHLAQGDVLPVFVLQDGVECRLRARASR